MEKSEETAASETTPRKRLHRADVIAEAIALADVQGLDAVTMRALATRLKVVPMAMYKHVADKDSLVSAMIEEVVEEFAAPSLEEHYDWRIRFTARIARATAVQSRHPWLRNSLETANEPGLNALTYMNALAGDLVAGGMSIDLTHYAMHALGSRIWGYNPEAFPAKTPESSPEPPSAEQFSFMQENFPFVTAIAMDAATRNPEGACNSVKELDFVLNLLLDSFERLRDAGWSSTPAPRA